MLPTMLPIGLFGPQNIPKSPSSNENTLLLVLGAFLAKIEHLEGLHEPDTTRKNKRRLWGDGESGRDGEERSSI